MKQLRESLFTDKLIKGGSGQTANSLSPLNFGNYLQLNTQNLQEAVDKVAEATGIFSVFF